MGLSITQEHFAPKDYQRFSARLTECLNVLEKMLQDPDFGGDTQSWGAELELYLVNNQGGVSHTNQELMKLSGDPQLSLELNRFNLEYNSRPVIGSSRPLSQIENELDRALIELSQHAKTLDTRITSIGILPTLKESDFGLQSMTDLPRYHALMRGLKNTGDGEFKIHINGEPPLKQVSHDVTLEGANTSFQVHYRVSPQRFANLYNGLLLATPIVMGLAANSPTLFGHKLWHETRVPLFKHAIDARPQTGNWRQPARVSLGQGFIRKSAYELFAQATAMHPPLLPISSNTNYAEQWHQGIAPGLDELRLHQNSIWSWLRPVYDPADGGHLRIELRGLPAGPTHVDMLANAAFYVGLAEGIADRIESYLAGMGFNYAKYNFYRAAQFGTHANLVWPIQDKHELQERPLPFLAQQLLPVARQGLEKTNMAEQEINKYLTVIEERIDQNVTGAQWQIDQLVTLNQGMQTPWPASPESLNTLLNEYMLRQTSGKPVAQWSAI